MTREEKAAAVRRLRDEEGLIWREIGARLGISRSSAHILYADPTGEKERVRKARYARPCMDCGALMSGSNGSHVKRCKPCADSAMTRWTRASIIEAIVRWNAEHGRQPAAVDWNATMARQRGLAERGDDYPATDTVQRTFGSWNAAIDAAGFDALPSGSGRRKVAA